VQDNSKKWNTLPCLLFVAETFYRGCNKCLILDVQCEGPSEVGYILLRTWIDDGHEHVHVHEYRAFFHRSVLLSGLWGHTQHLYHLVPYPPMLIYILVTVVTDFFACFSFPLFFSPG